MKVFTISIAMIMLLSTSACKKNVDKPNDENEHEAINSVTITFKENGVVAGTFKVEDPDGDGGNPPTRIDNINLQAGKTYTADLTLQNIKGTTVKDITATVQTQGRHHELFYIPAGVSVNIAKNDRDINNYPIGFNTTWVTTTAGTGTVLIKLMHKPFIKGPNDAPTIGHTDLSINLPLIIN